ncbi:MAG: hypothetical protein A2868_01390 [Candidatus Levybacteria bacterium RIFCSPHIGHO2_01_FULL_40_15b]|nr:MAG: hypothetical protein A2868_01390 [Candidatus Levybacteria bacterium RIFCSPHIGHO2_01_FULL_40_15b]
MSNKKKVINAKFNRLSEICSGIGHISVATVVIPYFIDRADLIVLILGSVSAVIFYFLSLVFAK